MKTVLKYIPNYRHANAILRNSYVQILAQESDMDKGYPCFLGYYNLYID